MIPCNKCGTPHPSASSWCLRCVVQRERARMDRRRRMDLPALAIEARWWRDVGETLTEDAGAAGAVAGRLSIQRGEEQ